VLENAIFGFENSARLTSVAARLVKHWHRKPKVEGLIPIPRQSHNFFSFSGIRTLCGKTFDKKSRKISLQSKKPLRFEYRTEKQIIKGSF
jgi:hypothetical protein